MNDVKRASLSVVYDGAGIEDGTMDVRLLAPALLGIADAVQAANASLNGDRAQVKIVVHGDFKQGSFHIDLNFVQTLWEQAKGLLGGSGVTSIANLLALLGFLGIEGGPSLLWLLRRLRGHKPDAVTDLPDGSVQLAVGDTVIQAARDVFILYGDAAVRHGIERAVAPLRHEGIEEFAIRSGNELVTAIQKSEVESFGSDATIDPQETPLLTSEVEKALEVVRLSFRQGNKWSLSDGSSEYSVLIDDEDFLGRVQAGDVRFGNGDVLRVILVSRTTRDKNGALHTVHRVPTVLDVLRRPSQGRLPFKKE